MSFFNIHALAISMDVTPAPHEITSDLGWNVSGRGGMFESYLNAISQALVCVAAIATDFSLDVSPISFNPICFIMKFWIKTA
jgi:hypothetical protein